MVGREYGAAAIGGYDPVASGVGTIRAQQRKV